MLWEYFPKPKGRPLPAQHTRAKAARSTVRSAVEHIFAGQKHRVKLFVRTIGISRAKVKIGMANPAYNFTRLTWLEARAARPLDRQRLPNWPKGNPDQANQLKHQRQIFED